MYEKDSNHSFIAGPLCIYRRLFEFWADEICVSSLAHSVGGDLPAQYGVCVFSSPAGNHSKATVVLEYGAETVQHSRVCGSVSGSSAAQYYGDSPASVFDAVRLFPAVALYHVWYQRDLAELSEREVFAGGNSRQYHPAFFLLRRCVQLDLLLCARKESFTINPDLCVHMKYACNRIFRFFYKFAMT